MIEFDDTRFTERVIVNEDFDETRDYTMEELDLDFIIVVESDLDKEMREESASLYPGLGIADFIGIEAFLIGQDKMDQGQVTFNPCKAE